MESSRTLSVRVFLAPVESEDWAQYLGEAGGCEKEGSPVLSLASATWP